LNLIHLLSPVLLLYFCLVFAIEALQASIFNATIHVKTFEYP
jgi:hypothetical protein